MKVFLFSCQGYDERRKEGSFINIFVEKLFIPSGTSSVSCRRESISYSLVILDSSLSSTIPSFNFLQCLMRNTYIWFVFNVYQWRRGRRRRKSMSLPPKCSMVWTSNDHKQLIEIEKGGIILDWSISDAEL